MVGQLSACGLKRLDSKVLVPLVCVSPSEHGVEIGKPLVNFHGVLSGTPTFQGNRDDLLGNSENNA